MNTLQDCYIARSESTANSVGMGMRLYFAASTRVTKQFDIAAFRLWRYDRYLVSTAFCVGFRWTFSVPSEWHHVGHVYLELQMARNPLDSRSHPRACPRSAATSESLKHL